MRPLFMTTSFSAKLRVTETRFLKTVTCMHICVLAHRYVSPDLNGTHPVYRFGAVLLELSRTKFHVTVYNSAKPKEKAVKDLSGVVDRCANRHVDVCPIPYFSCRIKKKNTEKYGRVRSNA